MKRGDVVLIAFPFTDASDVKLRPAVVVSADDLPTGPDVVVLPISRRIDGVDPHVLRVAAPELRATGLKKPSV
ncbi:MAG: type II toxin-antitoxin system PemK/MazF family toxin, partial [Planctomycetota bacterium]